MHQITAELNVIETARHGKNRWQVYMKVGNRRHYKNVSEASIKRLFEAAIEYGYWFLLS